MTHDQCARLDDGPRLRLNADSADDNDGDTVTSQDRKSVRDMILRFERTAINLSTSSESLVRHRDPSLGSLSSVVNPPQSHFQHLHPVVSHDRNSNVSVNSILSNASELSYESSSSGFVSDRKSGADFPVPHRPAPPPPEPFNDRLSDASKSPGPEEMASSDRRYSISTSSGSPIVMRRARQPPVIRRKSSISSVQGHGETLWSYGVRQTDLQKLLSLKRSESPVGGSEQKTVSSVSDNIIDSSDDSNGDSSDDTEASGHYAPDEGGADDTLSRDHSTDTLRNDSGEDGSVNGDNSSIASEVSGERSNYDNVSIKSISSFDMIPYQKYDSITVSSDEFGSEVCHAPDTEFLTVSAINEWCVSNSAESTLNPTETKREKYRRRLSERVNELIQTEQGYVERLRHVVNDYIPQLLADDVPDEMKVLKPDIFANIERIHRFHAEEFLPALRDCDSDLRKLGQCFRSFEKKFNMYVMYSRSNKRATRLVFEHKQFFHEKQMQLGDRLDLSSYLLEPVQRIPRYKLFLDDLVKTYKSYEQEVAETESGVSKLSADSGDTGGSNGEEEEPPLESLRLAKAMVEHVLTAIDDIMALENIRDCPAYINLLHQGRLLRQSEFFVLDPARRRRQLMRLFLFDKLLLLTAVYRKQMTVELFLYKDHIPVDDLGITAKETDQLKFSVWYKKRTLKSYKLEAHDPEVRSVWVGEITSLLWEQAMMKKELLLQQRGKRASMMSTNSHESTDDGHDDKYNSLRGVPGEVQRLGDPKVRRTTWYCE